MQTRYIPNFTQLTSHQVNMLASAIHRRHPDFVPHQGGEYESGEDLFHHCDACGLDHADVVLSLAPDPTAEAVVVLETLVGVSPLRRTIAPRHTRANDAVPRQKRPVLRDDRRVATVVPNPKRPGSASHARFELWRPGMTISEARAAGLTAGDVVHDISKGFITLEDQS